MTVALQPPNRLPEVPSEGGLILSNISWETYELLLQDVERQNLRLTYDDGRLSIVSPLSKHENAKKLIAGMVEQLALELNIPMRRLGSTTWKRKDRRKGLEADECYYVQHELQVRGRHDIDLTRDPPPDLAIEVEITHHPLDRPSVYAALGVPEIWRYDGLHLTAHVLDQGQYRPVGRSLA